MTTQQQRCNARPRPRPHPARTGPPVPWPLLFAGSTLTVGRAAAAVCAMWRACGVRVHPVPLWCSGVCASVVAVVVWVCPVGEGGGGVEAEQNVRGGQEVVGWHADAASLPPPLPLLRLVSCRSHIRLQYALLGVLGLFVLLHRE